MFRRGVLFFIVLMMINACAKVPITGRKQMNLLPESEMITMSFSQYDEFLASHEVISPGDPRAKKVVRVGNKVAEAVNKFLAEKNMSDRIAGFEWEFNLVNDNSINAWCMPGGKVVVYTGILPVTQDETGLAVVMGHEIAHAIARHGNERMSQQVLLQYGGQALDILMTSKPDEMRALFLNSYGIAGGMGSLAFSRSQETEADKLGLVFMAMAGYDPQEAVAFWERMSNASGGGAPPELLSTHPSDQTRIDNLMKYMPEAMKYYQQ
jgi:predicted Zn-dependent protease